MKLYTIRLANNSLHLAINNQSYKKMKLFAHRKTLTSAALFLLAASPLWMSAANPVVTQPYPQNNSTASLNDNIYVQGVATDSDNTMTEHWLEVKRPNGDWTWEGWLTSEPWGPYVGWLGQGYSNKSAFYRFEKTGTYVFRSSAYDPVSASWSVSSEKTVTVGGAVSGRPEVTLSNLAVSFLPLGSSVTVTGTATDSDGTMTEHWLEVKRPAGDWSWEGWLTTEPWGPTLNGSNYSSTKSTNYAPSTTGTYIFRTTAYDPTTTNWSISNEQQVTVTTAPKWRFYVNTIGSDVIVSVYVYATGVTSFTAYAQQGATTTYLPSGGAGQGPYYSAIGYFTTSTWPSGTYDLHFSVTCDTGTFTPAPVTITTSSYEGILY